LRAVLDVNSRALKIHCHVVKPSQIEWLGYSAAPCGTGPAGASRTTGANTSPAS
jgi:hypothetical protein